jgi:hypothetical protein
VALAVVGAAAVAVGVERELLHVAPGYAGLIETGWDGPLGHEEVLLRRVGVVSAAGALVATRWRRAAVVPAAAGGVVLFYAVRAVADAAAEPGFYRETRLLGGETTKFVLGAEPFLLVAGGTLLVVSGVVGWRSRAGGAATETTESSAA